MSRKIPAHLAHLKVFRGFPIPFAQMCVNDVPDFRAVDSAKVLACVTEYLCGICGIKLGEFCYFIGGEMCKENHLFADPAMHEACAEYTASVCPFVSGQHREYSERPIDEKIMTTEHLVSEIAPQVLYIFKTRTKKIRWNTQHGSELIEAGAWARVTKIQNGAKQ